MRPGRPSVSPSRCQTKSGTPRSGGRGALRMQRLIHYCTCARALEVLSEAWFAGVASAVSARVHT